MALIVESICGLLALQLLVMAGQVFHVGLYHWYGLREVSEAQLDDLAKGAATLSAHECHSVVDDLRHEVHQLVDLLRNHQSDSSSTTTSTTAIMEVPVGGFLADWWQTCVSALWNGFILVTGMVGVFLSLAFYVFAFVLQ